MSTDDATERWLAQLLAAAEPLGPMQLDVLRRTFGRVQLDQAHDADTASEAA